MRDPDLVHQAERAAAALEEAWIRWRTRHGLATGALPPVSSYVGYSVEEPWGQPRVVFGIEAAEAARLAAILDEDAYAGLPPADLTGVPERHQPGTASAAWTVPSSAAGVPAQALGPGKLAVRGSRPGDPARLPSAPSDQPGDSVQRPGVPAEPGDSMQLSDSVQLSGPVEQPAGPVEQPDVAADQPAASAGQSALPAVQPAASADKSSVPAERPAVAAGQSGLPAAWSSVLAEQFGRPTRSRAGSQSGAQLPAADQPSAGASSSAAVSSRPSAVPDRPARRPLAVTPAAEQPAAPESGQFAAAKAADDDVDYSRAEELTAEQPILPRALRRAAALADVPAELPDHEAAYLQELAARPGIVALRPRTAWPETEPAAGAEAAALPWPSVTYPGRPAPLLGQSAAAQGAAGQGAAAGKDTAQREVSPAPGGLVPFAAGFVPSAVAGSARDAGPQPGTQPTPADGTSVTRLLPVSRLNRTRKPSETGPWPAVGDPAQTPTDTAV